MTSLRRLQFSAYCNTQYGQYVCICGNIPQLGYWNPFKGLRLYTQQSLYPVWKSFNSILVIQNQPIQFKIVIVTSKNQFKWQNTKQNRIIIPQIDAYIKLTANEFQAYQIFPFSDGDQAVRTGLDILNDLQSDGSSSISFKSNYKFYQYYKRKDQKSLQSSQKPKNTSTFRDLSQFESGRSLLKTDNEFVTYIDSLMELEKTSIKKEQIGTQDCTHAKITLEQSHSTDSDKRQVDEDNWKNQDWIVYCGGTEYGLKNVRNSGKKIHLDKSPHRLTSLNKIVYSNSSQFLPLGRQDQ